MRALMKKVIHLAGIGGAGMSGLARLLVQSGWKVTGSDLREVAIPQAKTYTGHDASHVPPDIEVLVRSAAVPEDNVEVAKAREKGAEILTYPQMAGRIVNGRTGIAVAGTHGKSTTSAMIAFILSRAGFEPSFLIGAPVPQLEGNAAIGTGKHFVVEACEYNRSFLNFSPHCVVITNTEEDHLDYYRDLDEISGAFREFAGRVSEDGLVIGSADSPPSAAIVKDFKGRGETFSLNGEADWRARNISVEEGQWGFEVLKYGKSFGRINMALAGKHNVYNALAAIAAATWAGVGREIIQLALAEFQGTERRMQVMGEYNGAIVVDDYAHHPSEIKATLSAVKERYPERKIWAVFQPHLHSRTRQFLKDFAASFNDAHLVFVTDVYAARDGEAEKNPINASKLAKMVDENGKAALHVPTFDEVVSLLRRKVQEDCVILTMGAGDIGEVARRVVKQ